MGCRALIAYERSDASYTLHYSHNGAFNYRLKHQLTSETPFGGDQPSQWAQDHFDVLRSQSDMTADSYRVDRQSRTPVNPGPITVGVSLEEICSEYLDFLHHEAFYAISEAFEVTAYRTRWLGLEYDCETVESSETTGNGVIQSVTWSDGEPLHEEYSHGQFQALKDVVGDRIDDGELTSREARTYIIKKLRDWSCDETEVLVLCE
ncbi:DUF6735 family protein [Halorussus sp. MSC15.2]|uniref:DUF6735 family protein n=1 Tax=Halorussus sp. MSC15.2 TaxID=2283638 RepID=UPI0013D55703|nr:DUF6735 family protein [Halorussus sp. MSC15.2]NEU59144.1 hypothetical protein [Halorussus sp. MSC15.2]